MIFQTHRETTVLKKFSVTMCTVLFVFGMIFLLAGKECYPWFYLLGAVFLSLGIFAVNLLKPFFRVWMGLAWVLGWINTRVILSFLYFFVITPIGLVMRLSGNDLLDRTIDKAMPSYWKMGAGYPPSDYKRQF